MSQRFSISVNRNSLIPNGPVYRKFSVTGLEEPEGPPEYARTPTAPLQSAYKLGDAGLQACGTMLTKFTMPAATVTKARGILILRACNLLGLGRPRRLCACLELQYHLLCSLKASTLLNIPW